MIHEAEQTNFYDVEIQQQDNEWYLFASNGCDKVFNHKPSDVEIEKLGNVDPAFTLNLAANPNPINPTTFSFDWTPESSGLYTITLDGIAEYCPHSENLR